MRAPTTPPDECPACGLPATEPRAASFVSYDCGQAWDRRPSGPAWGGVCREAFGLAIYRAAALRQLEADHRALAESLRRARSVRLELMSPADIAP